MNAYAHIHTHQHISPSNHSADSRPYDCVGPDSGRQRVSGKIHTTWHTDHDDDDNEDRTRVSRHDFTPRINAQLSKDSERRCTASSRSPSERENTNYPRKGTLRERNSRAPHSVFHFSAFRKLHHNCFSVGCCSSAQPRTIRAAECNCSLQVQLQQQQQQQQQSKRTKRNE